MSRHVQLLWFADCPNHPVARRILTDAIERLAPERTHAPGTLANGQTLLATSFAQGVFGGERRRFGVVLVFKDRRGDLAGRDERCVALAEPSRAR